MAKSKSATADTHQAAIPTSQTGVETLPLFYKKPAVLELSRHGKAGVVPTSDYAFARETNSLPLNALEFIEAAKSYPIVFTPGESAHPVAIVGLEQENYFIGQDNQWQADHYIPAYARQYPFIFYQRPKDQRFYLCVDEAAPHYQPEAQDKAQAIYEGSEPSALAKQALEFCTSYYRHHEITKNFTADLVAHKLLSPYHSQVTLEGGRKLSLAGFLMIDEAAFNNLPDKAFLEFRAKGWLAFIYLSLASASNWKRLVALAAKQDANFNLKNLSFDYIHAVESS